MREVTGAQKLEDDGKDSGAACAYSFAHIGRFYLV